MTATDLNLWAERLECAHDLPELVRRLVRATTVEPERVNFPCGEGVRRGGWDGIVRAPYGNENVPKGWSGWELSCERDHQELAQ